MLLPLLLVRPGRAGAVTTCGYWSLYCARRLKRVSGAQVISRTPGMCGTILYGTCGCALSKIKSGYSTHDRRRDADATRDPVYRLSMKRIWTSPYAYGPRRDLAPNAHGVLNIMGENVRV